MNSTVEKYFPAAAELVGGFLATLARSDPEGHQGLQAAVAAGALLRLETALGRTGFIDCRLVLIDPAGEVLEVGSLEIDHHEKH